MRQFYVLFRKDSSLNHVVPLREGLKMQMFVLLHFLVNFLVFTVMMEEKGRTSPFLNVCLSCVIFGMDYFSMFLLLPLFFIMCLI